MKRKYLIYLLTLVMALSPVAVFADVEADAEAAPEAVEAVAPEAEEAVEVAAPEAVEAEAVEAADPVLGETVVPDVSPYDPCTWVNHDTREEAVNAAGEKVKGLFKASKKAGGTGLYYAGEDYKVVKEAGPRTVSEGWRFVYHPYTADAGEFWKDVTGGSYTYLFNDHSGDFYAEYLEGVYTVNGKMYYVQTDGTVRTTGGVFTDKDNNTYYIENGEIYATKGFVTDSTTGKKYYIPGNDGKILTTEGTFTASDGKLYYAGAGGVIPSTAGLYGSGSKQYYVNADGSVKTDEGFITVNGKKYLVKAGGEIRKTAGAFKYNGSYYVSGNDGAIVTTKGFVKASGNIYFVKNSDGVVKVSSAFKYKGKSYHATSDGTIAVGVHKWKGKYYYSYTSSGALRKKAGIVKSNGKRYFVQKTGRITTSKKFSYKGKTYVAGKYGYFRTKIFTYSGNKYYANSKGEVRTKAGKFKYNGERYYSKKGGILYKNQLFSADGKKYLAQKDATLKLGYFEWKGNYYLTNDKAAIYTTEGIYSYKNVQYFVKKGGAMGKNEFVEYKDKHYYCNSKGEIVKKTFTYKKIKITPNSKTGVISLEDYWKVFPDEKPSEDD